MSMMQENKRIREIEQIVHTMLMSLGLRVEGMALKGGKLQNLESAIGLDNTPRILYGKIVDALAYANCYKVQLDGSGATAIAVKGGQSAFSIIGGRELNTLTPGTRVVVLSNPKHLYSIILCTEPDMSLRPKLGLSDSIYQGSNVGFQVDSIHNYPYEMGGGAGIFNWSAGRPVDSLTAGEIGYIFETGVRLFADSFMTSLAVNEACGVFGFYHDNLLRVAGYNYQERTSSSERVSYNDQGEHHYIYGSTPYPYEHMGMFNPQENPLRTIEAQAAQIDEAWYSYLEPQVDNQIPFHRYVEYGGYLGQGRRRVLWAPPQDAEGPYKLGSQDTPIGLFQEVLTMGGAWGVQSAKSISLLKRGRMAGFKPIKDPQDPQGDTEENYKFAGVSGGGSEHKVSDTLGGEDEEDGHVHALSAVQDYHANLFSWQANHPFYYHEADWHLEEDSTRTAEGAEPYIPQYADLQQQGRITPPTPYTLRVDHRYTASKYYETEAFLDLTEHGGFVLAEACGATVMAVGGEVYIDAPANIFLRSGKNVNVLAGRDFTMRAYNSADLSVTKKDIRIKAGNSLYAVAGTEGSGGVLIESQGDGTTFDYEQDGEDVVTSGVVLKAKDSVTSLIGQAVFIKSKGGDVTIDADEGGQKLLVNADTAEFYVNTGFHQHFGSQGNIRKTNAFTEGVSTIASNLGVVGTISCNESIFLRDWVIAGGHFASKFAPAYEGKVGDSSSMHGQVLNYLQQIKKLVEDIYPKSYAKPLYQSLIKDMWLEENKLGNDEMINKMKFGYRTTDQYKVGQNFRIFESLWQQKARMTQQQMPTWDESGVSANNKETYPYPGEIAFEGQAFIQVPTKLYDHETASYAAYGSDYEDPQYEAVEPASLKTDYTIIDAS
jgi:hypothetical protein